MVTILISATYIGAALIGWEALISVWTPKGAALVRGPALIRGNTLTLYI